MTSLENKGVKIYLLPSIRLQGRGLPLNMAAVHPKMILTHTRKRGEERHGYSSPQGKVGNGRRATALTEKPPPPHPIHPHSLRWTRTPIWSLLPTEQPSVTPLSLALSLSSTSTSLYSFNASKRMLPSLWKRKRRGKVMSSVLRPSPAIWNSGAVSLLLPSLSSEKEDNSQPFCWLRYSVRT